MTLPDLSVLRAEQRDLAARTVREDSLGEVRFIGGVDISASRFEQEVHAAIVVLEWPSLNEVARAGASQVARMPYITGFLGFREVPAAVSAWNDLPVKPDLLMVDGQGLEHPRRCGVATHLGVTLDVPAIGVAKSRLCGTWPELPEPEGSAVPITDRGEVVGMLLRSRLRANPIHISIGHRVSLDTAMQWVRATLRGRRLPEPTRRAHEAASVVRKTFLA
ncbi:deoxyribonuclease V [Sabulicella rubraurantiaca]|uniref:deoxyribonuclease V n=1 Tax=Sabulicella rubraurantiaca TaxID=2811429 RepID=UPI001A9751FE|nr:deoxyribonuclease V [Sabulicella rubraurantiaca]